jgi:hypothetical protein
LDQPNQHAHRPPHLNRTNWLLLHHAASSDRSQAGRCQVRSARYVRMPVPITIPIPLPVSPSLFFLSVPPLHPPPPPRERVSSSSERSFFNLSTFWKGVCVRACMSEGWGVWGGFHRPSQSDHLNAERPSDVSAYVSASAYIYIYINTRSNVLIYIYFFPQ